MREALLRRNITIISIASVVLAGLILLIMKLRFFDTVNADLTKSNGLFNTAVTTGADLEKNLIAERIALNNKSFAQQQTNAFRQRFRSLSFNLEPTPDEGPRKATWRRYLNEYYSDYGVELRRVLIQAADESGVILTTSVKVQAPPQNPEDVGTPPGGFLKPLTDGNLVNVHVTGSWSNMLRFFERINQSEVLMTVGSTGTTGLKVESTGSGVVASFNMTPYLVASGPSAQLPTAAVSAGTATQGGIGSPTGGPVPQSTSPAP
ncbi:hypothetical protein IAD21_01300 [Abditibacteriota bacterium]|nr:hypothetical protein IAD21_01300 [Abditibacteriota bacterium]